MKYLLEMILVAILIVVLYQTPSFLHMHLNTILGKLLLVSAVAYLAINHGLNAGLLGSLYTSSNIVTSKISSFF